MKLTPILLCIAAGLHAQVRPQGTPSPSPRPDTRPSGSPAAPATGAPALVRPMLTLQPRIKADLLPPGKTQGSFHLNGLVRPDRTVLLRWANTEGEMPTEGVRVFRQKVGETTWKELTGRKPIGFLQGRQAEKRLEAMPAEEREKLLAYPFGNVAHDPATRLRVVQLPALPPKGAPARAQDLSPAKSLEQFRSLRAQGKLNRTDLRMMHMRADLDPSMADILGLSFTDDPGKGQFRYRVEIALPEGGTAEAVCPRVFDTREATPIPLPQNLSAASGNGEVLLNWDETPTDVVGGYNVYRAESPGGPWKRLNEDPVKKVELELEDPEQSLRRSIGIQEGMVRMLRPLPEAARTPQKVQEAHAQALAQVEAGKLPELSPAASKAVKAAVASGRLRPGGKQAPISLFTDSIRTAGNALQVERTYYYKVTPVDIGGLEQPLASAPQVAGIPKDLEPPRVPGRPHLKAEALALSGLRDAQASRLQDTRLKASQQALLSRLPRPVEPLTPFQLQGEGPGLAPAASSAGPGTALRTPLSSAPASALGGGMNLAEARRQHLSQVAVTVPAQALRKVAETSTLRSGADGTVPPAQLVWTPSPDPDLKGYQVHKAVGNGAFAKVAETTAPEWTDTDLQPGQAYRYAIVSVDRLGNASAPSPAGEVDVCDGSLPSRLAVPQLKGQVAKELPAALAVRRLLRPVDRLFPSGSLRAARARLTAPKAAQALVTDFQAPKLSAAPRTSLAARVSAVRPGLAHDAAAPAVAPGTGVSAPAAVAPSPAAAKALELKPGALQAGEAKVAPNPALVLKPRFKSVTRSVNPMLLAPAAPAEIHVSLEWGRPIQGLPMEYVVQQAPRKMELVSVKRPAVAFQPAFKAFQAPSLAPLGAGLAPALAPRTAAALPASPATSQGTAQGASQVLVASTPALHAAAARGLVATQGEGLRLSTPRAEHMARLQAQDGPGTFTRLNEAPLATERYGVTFPAQAAQYGGATYYFRVQASTREFGRVVEGPVSAPIEVRLPDIVPPPPPVPGGIELRETTPGTLQVALGWLQDKVPDLAGILVDRQPMTYTLVDGEPRPGTPAGPAARITPSPVKGAAFTDTEAPGGFQRYTLRSVDGTGNVSEAQGHLDILVPGEPVPAAPTQLSATGTTLTWKAGPDTAGFTVWRSFTGEEDDWECISGILPADRTSFTLPPEGILHLRVLARSASGMHGSASGTIVRGK